MKNEMYIGQKVRSFNSPYRNRNIKGSDANFVEGKVIAIASAKESPDACTSFKIAPSRIVINGDEQSGQLVKYVWTPVNGLLNVDTGVWDGVEMLDDTKNTLKVGDIDINFISSVNAYRAGSYLGTFSSFENAVDFFDKPANQSYHPHAYANA